MKRSLALLLALHLTACGAYGLADGLSTADTIVRGACAAYTGGSRQEALAALSAAQQQIVQAMISEAVQRSDPQVVAAIAKGLDATHATLRALTEQVAALGEKPAACPVATVGVDAGAD